MSPKSKIIRIALVVVFCWSFLSNLCFGEITAEEMQKIKAAVPSKASAVPKKPRKLLVFNRCDGYKHTSIPYISKALEIMGQKTGAFTVTESVDMSVFKADNIKQYDAICFNNCTRLKFEDKALVNNLLDFAKGGKGVIGIHAATDNFYKWPQAAEMMGGLFDGHPWSHKDTVTIKVVESAHPLCTMFDKTGFQITDEIYQFKAPYSRAKLRVLLAIDTAKTDMNKNLKRKDGDFAISWVRKWGKGRVFYCSLGHNHHIAWDAKVLAHYLAGIQYALGDLQADATPSGSDMTILEAALEEIKGYDYGKSREKLTMITELTRDAYGCPETLTKIENLFTKFLKGDATFAAKQYICKELSIIGTKDSVPTLIEMCVNPKTTDIALYALQRIPDKAVDTALRKVLDKTSGKSKIGIINTLGMRGDSESVSAIKDLVYNPDQMVVRSAVSALGHIADFQASKALAEALNKTKGQLRLMVLDSYLKCADKFLAEGNERQAMPIYTQLYNSDEPIQIRSASLRGIITAKKTKAADMIIAIAISLTKQVPGRKMTKALGRKLFKLSVPGQLQLLSALGQRGDSIVLPKIIKAAGSDEESVRTAALEAIGKLGDHSTIDLLAQTAATSKSTEQEAARQSLYSLRSPKVDDSIVAKLSSKIEPGVKIELIRSVSHRRISNAAKALLKNSRDDNVKVSTESLKTLRVVGGVEDLPALVDVMIETENNVVRSEAEKTVTAVANKNAKGERAKVILSRLSTVKNVEARCSVLSVLGKIGEESSIGILRKALTDKDIKVQNTAIRALSEWPTDSPVDDLRTIAKSTKDTTQQVLALRGFVHLLSIESSRPMDETAKLYKEAMQLASGVNEKKMVLAGLANMKDMVSLQLAADYLDNKQLGQEAAAAAIKIAKFTLNDNSQETKDVLEKLVKVIENESIRKEASKMLDKIKSSTK